MLAISVDSHFSHLAWINTEKGKGGVANIQIPLVSDITKEISKAYEVLVTSKEDELLGASLRGLFIIDGKGIIRSLTINDAPVGRSVDEALRTIKALQHADKHGVVCPANWQPGSKTIIPDQIKKEEYFKDL